MNSNVQRPASVFIVVKRWILVILVVFIGQMIIEADVFAENPSAPMVSLKTIRGGHHDAFSSIVFEFENAIEYEQPIVGEKEIFIVLKNVISELASFRSYKTFDSWVELEDSGKNLNVRIGRPEDFLELNCFLLDNPHRLVINLYREKPPTPLIEQSVVEETTATSITPPESVIIEPTDSLPEKPITSVEPEKEEPADILHPVLRAASATQVESINLHNFISLVKQYSKDLKLAAKEKEMAKVNKRQAVAAALPKLAAQAEYTRNLNDYYMYIDLSALTGTPGTAEIKANRKNEYSANIILKQTLFSRTVGSALKAAKQYQKLTDFVYDASLQQIINGARTMFYRALLLQKFWEVSKAAEENAKDNYHHMKLKFDHGIISEFELLQAEVRWKNAVPQTAQAKRNYELMLNNMKNWAGIEVEKDIEIIGDFEDYPPLPNKPLSDSQSFHSILGKRPDYNALLWEEKLRDTNVDAKYAAYYPSVSGQLLYAFSAESDEWKLEQENELYMAGLILSWPLYTGGYRSTEVQKAKIELHKTRVNIAKTKDNIYNEVSNIYLQLEESFKRIDSAKSTLKAAEKAFQIAENTAKSGLATQLQLKDARVGYDQAMMNYYAATFDYLNAYFQWEWVTGDIDVTDNSIELN